MPSIVKELVDERFQERIDKTIKTYVKNMNRDDLEHKLIGHLDDYYNNVATHEEREEFLREHEELPF
tara:strand:+ start:525 stop:725 length:201 start_codon:yes stop_codon:yes gene_type:complete